MKISWIDEETVRISGYGNGVIVAGNVSDAWEPKSDPAFFVEAVLYDECERIGERLHTAIERKVKECVNSQDYLDLMMLFEGLMRYGYLVLPCVYPHHFNHVLTFAVAVYYFYESASNDVDFLVGTEGFDNLTRLDELVRNKPTSVSKHFD